MVDHQPYNVIDKNNIVPAGSRRQNDKAGTRRTGGYPHDGITNRAAVSVRHFHTQITVPIGKKRQFHRFADNKGYQTRRKNLRKITPAKLFLLFTQIFFIDDKDTLPFHLSQHSPIGSGKMLLQQSDFIIELFEQRLGCTIARKHFFCILTGTAQTHDIGDTYLEKLILVVGKYS